MKTRHKILFSVIVLIILASSFWIYDYSSMSRGSSVVSPSIAPVERIGNVGENVEGDFMTSDGVRIHYWFYNRGTETATVFLHGGPGHGSQEFRDVQANDYANSFGSLLVFDQRGCGESDTNPTLADSITFARNIQDINELRDYVLPKKKVVILGRSYGGLLAAHYADSHPKEVGAYILVSPGPFDFPTLDAQAEALWQSAPESILNNVSQSDAELVMKRRPSTPNVEIPAKDVTLEDAALEPDVLDYGTAFHKNEPSFFENNYHLLTSIGDVPTLVVYGLYDPIVMPMSIEGMKPYLPGATFLPLPGGHYSAYAYQDEFFAGVKEFLKN